MSLGKWLALDKLQNLQKILQQNGGIRGSLYKLYRSVKTHKDCQNFVIFFPFFRQDDLKHGELVGEDRYGNKYFQNNTYFYGKKIREITTVTDYIACVLHSFTSFSINLISGRNRWVEYNPNVGIEYDGSMIPAEWFGWMHYKTDEPPTVKAPVKYKWMADHDANPSMTQKAYVPYSTTKPKVESWSPGQK